MQLREKVDVMVSHDWPTSVHRYGNAAQLLRAKPYFQQEVEQDCLGSPASWQLLQARPSVLPACVYTSEGLVAAWHQFRGSRLPEGLVAAWHQCRGSRLPHTHSACVPM